jgi:indole-3-glycerol phosphate synthase
MATLNMNTPTILKNIINTKHQEVMLRKKTRMLNEMIALAKDQPEARGFYNALHQKISAGLPAVIAEIKKASPSKGILRDPFNPSEIAESYEKNGAAGFFKGMNCI